MNPAHVPRRTSGRDIRSHMQIKASKVENGIALDDAWAQTKRLKKNTSKNIVPGTRRDV